MSRRNDDVQGLQELTETLAIKFKEPSTTITDLSRFLSTTCFTQSDRFRDEIVKAPHFTSINLGDELVPPNDKKQNIGIKRNGIALDAAIIKKRKLNNDIVIDNSSDSDSSDDFDMVNNKPQQKKKKGIPSSKYNIPEIMNEIEAPNLNPSSASEFFDPIRFCRINLEKETKMNENIRNYMISQNNLSVDLDLRNDCIKYINLNKLKLILNKYCAKYSVTIDDNICNVFGLSLQDYLKNMFDNMNKWRLNRINIVNVSDNIKYENNDIDKWINDLNDKYSIKQQIIEAEDEAERLETEKADLDFKELTGVLTDEEKKRQKKLEQLIKQSSKNKNDNNNNNNSNNMTAVGGDFSFNFGNKNKKNKYNGRRLQNDKFYAIDVINMLENNKKYSKRHLNQLSTLYLKQ